jgi:hypothetical protein
MTTSSSAVVVVAVEAHLNVVRKKRPIQYNSITHCTHPTLTQVPPDRPLSTIFATINEMLHIGKSYGYDIPDNVAMNYTHFKNTRECGASR